MTETATPNYRPGNRTRKGRRSAPKVEDRRVTISKDPYAYIFEDEEVGTLKVLNSDREAWWLGERGRTKLEKLIAAWKIDCNDKEACIYAAISPDQLKYFQELHPDLYTIKDLCRERMGFVAKKRFAKDVESNGDKALTYLRMKRKDEGYTERTDITSGGLPLQPQSNTIVFVDFSKKPEEPEQAPIQGEVREPEALPEASDHGGS